MDIEASKDILFECAMGGSRVVGIGNDIVVKYGPRVEMTEANSLAFVNAHTTLPVPKLVGSYFLRARKRPVKSRRGNGCDDHFGGGERACSFGCEK